MKKPANLILLVILLVGSFLAGSWYSKRGARAAADSSARRILYYVDPMHPAYTSDKPGIAPDCGMQLEPVYSDQGRERESPDPDSSLLPVGTIHITPEKQQTVGIRVGEVEKTAGAQTVRLLGRIAADERRIYRLNAATDGWIQQTFSDSTGSVVKKDQVLAATYAPEFLGAEQAYFYALNTLDRLKATGKETSDQIAITQVSIQQAADSLRNMGMGEVQIQALARERRTTQNIELRSPATGFVLERNISPGQRFERGKEFYRIADLSRVWILADIFENEARFFRPGVTASVALPHQGKVFQARVSDVLPQFDPNTRTLKVRLEADNPGYALRPDMFVDVALPIKLPAGITVPADAVLDSGLKKTVFVAHGNGYFEPRTVETGWRYGDRVEIVRGLTPGERIVVSGNFLVDSESRMKLAAAGMQGRMSALNEGTKDPVCGMGVDEGQAKAAGNVRAYRARVYYFCSDHCKRQFDQDPERYLMPKGSIAERRP